MGFKLHNKLWIQSTDYWTLQCRLSMYSIAHQAKRLELGTRYMHLYLVLNATVAGTSVQEHTFKIEHGIRLDASTSAVGTAHLISAWKHLRGRQTGASLLSLHTRTRPPLCPSHTYPWGSWCMVDTGGSFLASSSSCEELLARSCMYRLPPTAPAMYHQTCMQYDLPRSVYSSQKFPTSVQGDKLPLYA